MANMGNNGSNGQNSQHMILRPVDFSILKKLTEGRNVAGNLYIELDVSRPYVNERLGHLADYNLVRRIGPNENVGLYEITDKGHAALKHRDKYGEVDDFEEFLEEKTEN